MSGRHMKKTDETRLLSGVLSTWGGGGQGVRGRGGVELLCCVRVCVVVVGGRDVGGQGSKACRG